MTTNPSEQSNARVVRRYTELLLVFVLGFVPWSVQTFATGSATLLFPWGLVTPSTLSVTTVIDFLFRFTVGLPDYILAWPLGVVCYLVSLGSVVSGYVFGRSDIRITVAGLVLAGVTQLEVARGFSVQPGRTAWPVGTLALWAVAAYLYRSHTVASDS
ncbi:TIGR04206 family protein [Haloferax mediterranei ATCC 33500]|uniref:TIGR04206 family protein n=1 Tax=Haloferax mediterranei (strain ATCC 33500 / DSM 1411 / JCM 8866 / NBRC 14739 / NCIMB 2177 / R-4) TaxID=523841 RepID=I3R2Z3_HALMT|nr:TIGR04206 family protein [Haloferax mediterranei]AFK18603.1 hypothetical protein HFX_0882 [Haloferax mediterranei ATCC 33500]AHZ22025.1 hypothetical protein BM92_04820 [Haloferax mediterranei ATCC 33500]EMA02122.1 hypothetical protein C439_06065 [Haloferax mediterranei ATCC 33500]MDX5988690.1 TIGR04206 family protein [Haloferax mediterranei ATCC 33500]QCQ75101.1 TIGR04206 family protein [Haloferax mediterranei ATCC 33500]